MKAKVVAPIIFGVIVIALGYIMLSWHESNNKMYLSLLNSGYTPLEAACIMSVSDSGACDKVYAANQVQIMMKAAKNEGK